MSPARYKHLKWINSSYILKASVQFEDFFPIFHNDIESIGGKCLFVE